MFAIDASYIGDESSRGFSHVFPMDIVCSIAGALGFTT
jgi:hypothetical protein